MKKLTLLTIFSLGISISTLAYPFVPKAGTTCKCSTLKLNGLINDSGLCCGYFDGQEDDDDKQSWGCIKNSSPACNDSGATPPPIVIPTIPPPAPLSSNSARATHGIFLKFEDYILHKEVKHVLSYSRYRSWELAWSRTSQLYNHTARNSSLATDGKRWCKILRKYHYDGAENKAKLYIYCTKNPTKDPLQSKNWQRKEFSSEISSYLNPKISSDGKYWCISDLTSNKEKPNDLICTTKIGQDPLNINNWVKGNIKGTSGKIAKNLATDGLRWCYTEQVADKKAMIGLTCTIESGVHPLVSRWKKGFLTGFGTPLYPPALATDGKRWCALISSNINNKNKAQIICSKDIKNNILSSNNWQKLPGDFGPTRTAPSLTTDGVRWCLATTSSYGRAVMRCNKAYSDPMVYSNWETEKIGRVSYRYASSGGGGGSLYSSGKNFSVVMEKSCFFNGDQPRYSKNCCEGLQLINGICQVPMAEIIPVNIAGAHKYKIDGQGFDSKIDEADQAHWKETQRELVVFEALFTSIPEIAGSPTSSSEALSRAAYYRRTRYLETKKWLDGELAKMKEAGAINVQLKDLPKSNPDNIPSRTPLLEKMAKLLGTTCEDDNCNLEMFQSAALVITIATKHRIRTYFEKLVELSNAFDQYLQQARVMAINEDWGCENAKLKYCGSWRLMQPDPNNPFFGEYLVDPIMLPRYFTNQEMTEKWIETSKKFGLTRGKEKVIDQLQEAMSKDSHFKNFVDSYGKEIENTNIGAAAFEMVRMYTGLEVVNDTQTTPVTQSWNSGRDLFVLSIQETNYDAILYYLEMIKLMVEHANSLYAVYQTYATKHISPEERGYDGSDEALKKGLISTKKKTFEFKVEYDIIPKAPVELEKVVGYKAITKRVKVQTKKHQIYYKANPEKINKKISRSVSFSAKIKNQLKQKPGTVGTEQKFEEAKEKKPAI